MHTLTRAPHRSVRESRIFWVRRMVALAVIAVVALCAVLFIRSEASASNAEPLFAEDTQMVIVEEGQSLWEIAREVAGGEDVRDVLTTIVDMNGLDSSTVHPGQRILVPSR